MIRNFYQTRNALPYARCISVCSYNRPILHQNQPTLCSKISVLRCISFQASLESIAKTQSGVFKSISESTPVEYLQTFLINVHDTTGLPWWATIITTTILLRTCVTVPLAIHQQYIIAKFRNMQVEMNDIVKELKMETSLAVKMYNWDEKTARYNYNRSLKKQYNALIVRDNCHPFKAGLLVFFQIPLWICFSISLRNLVYMLPHADVKAQITLLELSLGGFGWIPNLTQVDSSFIIPITLGIVNLAIIELNVLSRPGAPTKMQFYINNIFRVLALCMVPIAACVPSCLSLYWITSSTYGLLQNFIFLSPRVKRLCRIPKSNGELENPYNYVLVKLKDRLNYISSIFKIT